MKGNKSVYLIVLLFFVTLLPQIAFGQNVSSKFSNNGTSFNINGLYISNNQDKYFLKQIGNSIWWTGTDSNGSLVKNIFKGTITGHTITGQWIELPLNLTDVNGGSANFTVNLNSGNISISKLFSNNNLTVNQLNKFVPNLNNIIPFMVSINEINVINPRAPLYDVLYVGLGAKKDNGDPLISTNYLGARTGNSNISLNLNVGPFKLDRNDKGLTVEFIGLNKENVDVTSTLINIKEILTQLFDPSFNSFDVSNPEQGDVAIRSLSPDLHLYACNGHVFADKIFIPTEELAKSLNNVTGYSREKIYTGSESPVGCGPDSVYQIKWSIIPLK